MGAPAWIIEITSPSTAKKDLNEKFNLYESSGVKEYWVVFPKDRYIMVYLLNDKGIYELVGNFENNKETPFIKSSLFPDLQLIMDDIFEQ